MTRCKRCGDPFELRCVGDRYCPPCDREVKAILAVEERRQAARTFRAKDFTRLTAPVV